ncbi:MAG: glycosyltransferase family 39 protein, partial [Candidatus Omnitrophica bacterium]|nr:glycosyltransferase family 39 protein [Candidatus Omnitrophota bacterium]
MNTLFRRARLLTLLVISLGLLLRVVQYLANRSLWLDEAFLTFALLARSYAGLLRQPLEFLQTAPPVFLWLQKLVVQVFGSSEFVLRALPLAAGLASVPLFYVLAKRLLEPWAAAVAVALFALSSNLVYYSTEVKPYGWDVAVAILLTLILMEMPTARLKLARLVGYGLAGAVALWCSYPSAVLLVAFMVWSVVVCWRRGTLARLARLLPVWTAWAVSFLVLYLACLRGVAEDQQLRTFYHQFWGGRFPAASASFWGGVAEWTRVFVESFRDPGALHLPVVAAVIFLVGAAGLARSHGSRVLLMVLPIGISLVLAAWKLLPFGNRLVLFLVPFLLLPIGEGVRVLCAASQRPLRIVGALAGVALIGPTVVVAAQLLWHPIQIEELKPVLAHVSRHRRPTDAVYVYYWSQYPFRYYASRYGFDERSCLIGQPLTEPSAWQQLATLRHSQR